MQHETKHPVQREPGQQSQTLPVGRRRMLAAAGLALPTMTVGAASQPGTPAVPSHGKAALVTGSSRGIGAATARRLAADGYAVTVNYLSSRDLAAVVVSGIEGAGGRAIAVQADVSDPAAVKRLFDTHDAAFGGVDVVVANAGIMRLAAFQDMADADFDRMFAVNAKGSFNTLREAARRVRTGGRIIALSSSQSKIRSPAYGPYGASKALQEHFVNVLAKELQSRMISVNAVAPGAVNTTLFTHGKSPALLAEFARNTPHKRLAEPSDIADNIALLCSKDGFWINGETIFNNGGLA